MDPLSLVLGALPLAMQAVQASKALLGFMADIRGAPGNIKAVSKEVHAFYNVLFTLSVVLKDQDVQTAISGNNTLLETVETLIKPITNCRDILGQLSVKLEKLRSSYPETHDVRSSLVGVKWSLFSKNEISKLRQTLEAEKLTISVALNVITMITSMRVLTLTEENRAISEAPIRGDLDSSTVISPLAHVSRETSLLQLSPPGTYSHSDLERTVNELEATYMSMNQISESLEAIVHGTQYAVMSPDRLLHRRIAHVYQDLSKAGIQIQQLKSSIGQFKELRKSVKAAASSGNVRTSKFEDLESQWDGLHKGNPAVVEVFFDCVSRFSSHDSGASIDELQMNFFGSPEYRFESLPSFYPEQYVAGGSISKELFAVAMLPSTDSQQTVRYFLDYAETARRWQRVVVLATFHGERQQTDALRVASSDDYTLDIPKVLPSAVHSLLRTILPVVEFYSSVTRISLDLKVGESGQIMAESERIEVVEDELEVSKSDEMEFLQYMKSICCKHYVESDVVTYSRIHSTSYKVYVDSEACVENKVMFASSKDQGNNTTFLDYLDEIKHFISLRRCAKISEFRGVVLDDTRRHLRSYLKELPMFTSVENLLELANSRSMTIPLPIRVLWARQLIQAIIEIHSQGVILGAFNPNCVAIRADGTAIFYLLRRSEKYLRDRVGRTPPELRNRLRPDYPGSAIRDRLNFNTDIFQLGLVLWHLTEYPKNTGHLCAVYDCTHWPRRTCTAPHANPVELPACSNSTPAYLCDIIRDCRLPDPQSRISTNELAHILSATPQPDVTPAEIQEALTPYIDLGIDFGFAVYCDECGEITTEVHFHCNICLNNDYDICQACFEKGRYCLVPDHRLIKRKKGKNDFIDIS